MEALHNLGIDFKVLLAQIVNFGIILFLLTKFLYKPLLKVLDDRKKKIEDGLKYADDAAKSLAHAQSEYEKKLEEAKQEALKILAEARAGAEKDRQKILSGAQVEAENIIASAHEAMLAEKRKMSQEIKSKIGTLAVLIVEKALKADLGDAFYKRHLEKVLQEVKK